MRKNLIVVAMITIALTGCVDSDRPVTLKGKVVAYDEKRELREKWNRLLQTRRGAEAGIKDDITKTNEAACKAWLNWKDIKKFEEDAGKNFDNQAALNGEMKDRAKILAQTAVRGKGKLDCNSEIGTGFAMIEEAIEAIDISKLSETDAGVTPAEFRAAIIREIKPTVDELKKELLTKGNADLNGDTTGFVDGVVKRYHLTPTELGLTEAQLKDITM